MFESYKHPLLPQKKFFFRIGWFVFLSFLISAISLLIGVLGYHFFENLSWIDSLLNASMILGGMGPVNVIQTFSGKLFASFYALFSGIIFLVVAGILTAPIFHRFLHKFHLEKGKDN